MADHDELIAQFVEASAVSPQQARDILEAADWDYASAMTDFHNPAQELDDPEEGDSETEAEAESNDPQPSGRRLGDAPATGEAVGTAAEGSSKSSKKGGKSKKFATLGDFSNAAPEGDNSDDSQDDKNQDMFAGGEKSGLAVKNPDDIKKKILDQARKSKPRPGGDDPTPSVNHFTGAAHTLGGDDTPSQSIPPRADPNAPRRVEKVERTLHFWADGFSVDDGDLFSSSDPRNADILNGIRQGRAPLGIMNVQMHQEVDVEIRQHEGNYVKPKAKYKPFGGQGNRLGSPTPGDAIPAFETVPSPTLEPETPEAAVVLNDQEPIISLQIRLGNGTRLPTRFNTSHTIGDVYNHVRAADRDSRSREWVLMTTFPSQELNDLAVQLGGMPDFKKGGVVVQKWK